MRRHWLAFVPGVLGFWCLWQAAEYYDVPPFQDGQWRLLGWGLIVFAGWLRWKFTRPARS